MNKRLCRICGKALSDYNPEDICLCHQTGMVIKEKSPKSLCTSYDAREFAMNPQIPKPGEAGYDDMTFDETVMGAVMNEDGDIFEIDLDGMEITDTP